MLLQELIQKNESGEVYVSSLKLHEYLQVKTRHNDWIRRQIKNYGLINGQDFYSELRESTGGRRGVEHFLTLSGAKELAMVERTEIGRKTRQYFIKCEQELINIEADNLK